jgi:hypothetical protein
MRKFEEYAPCKNSLWGYHRQGFCQAGFSAALSQVKKNKKQFYLLSIIFFKFDRPAHHLFYQDPVLGIGKVW